jgi:hypothetical protein
MPEKLISLAFLWRSSAQLNAYKKIIFI